MMTFKEFLKEDDAIIGKQSQKSAVRDLKRKIRTKQNQKFIKSYHQNKDNADIMNVNDIQKWRSKPQMCE